MLGWPQHPLSDDSGQRPGLFGRERATPSSPLFDHGRPRWPAVGPRQM